MDSATSVRVLQSRKRKRLPMHSPAGPDVSRGRKQRKVDSTYVYNKDDLTFPVLADFNYQCFAHLRHDHFIWGEPSPPVDQAQFRGLVARPPKLPNPLDDEIVYVFRDVEANSEAKEQNARELRRREVRAEAVKAAKRAEIEKAKAEREREKQRNNMEKEQKKMDKLAEKARQQAEAASARAKKEEAATAAKLEKARAKVERLKLARDRRANAGKVRKVRQLEEVCLQDQMLDEDLEPETSALMKLPLDIRECIYRELLVSDKPVEVHSGWEMVYRRRARSSPMGLSTSVLRLSKSIYREASHVLYGHNTFLYRLRDPTAPLINVANMALDGNENGEGLLSVDNDPEWEERRGSSRRNRRKQKTAEPKRDINFKKHLASFRDIIIEAESNRFSEKTQQSMAKAIDFFSYAPSPQDTGSADANGQRSKGAAVPNIRTLTIRVAPLKRDNVSPGESEYTFVDFFAPDSPIIAAIKGMQCQFLRVDIMTKNEGDSTKKTCCRLRVDLRHQQIMRQAGDDGNNSGNSSNSSNTHTRPDIWANDMAMLDERRGRVRRSEGAIDGLRGRIRTLCEGRKLGSVGGENAEAGLWDDFEVEDWL